MGCRSSEATPRRPGSCFWPPSSICPRASFPRCSIRVTSLFRTSPLSLGVAARPSLIARAVVGFHNPIYVPEQPIVSRSTKRPRSRKSGAGAFVGYVWLQLFGLEVLAGGAADGTLVGWLYALHLLVADGADHRDGHRRVRDLAVLGLYLLAGVAGEVGDGDLAGYDVLHRVARPGERIFNEREVYVRHAALACQFLSHVARDVPHEALGLPLQTLDGLLGPGELLRPALGDQRAGLLEGAVVYG